MVGPLTAATFPHFGILTSHYPLVLWLLYVVTEKPVV